MPVGLAKHGYTVANGWFEGTCGGSGAPALELSRDRTDSMCAQVLAECDGIEKQANRWASGAAHPARIARTSYRRGEDKTLAWDEASGYEQTQGLKTAIANATSRVRHGRMFVEGMLKLASERHGQPLWEVPRPVPPRTLRKGDIMFDEGGRKLVIAYIERARAYFNQEIDGVLQPRRGWVGLASARRMVEATEAAASPEPEVTPPPPSRRPKM